MKIKTTIQILALLLLTNIAMAQMPCTNDCVGTNANPTMPPPIPLEALQLRINPATVGLSNTIPNNLYQIEGSINLLDWMPLTVQFTNATGAEKVFSWTNHYVEQEWFRAHDVTCFTAFEEVLPYPGGDPDYCSGVYVGSVQFYKDSPEWGFVINTNTVLHTFSVERTNARIQSIGIRGDIGCGTNSMSVSGYSPVYRFAVFFPDNLPDTNIDYPAQFGGFLP